MSIFLTGATGYLGSYIATDLLQDHSERLALLVRAETIEAAEKRLWKSFQLHMDFDTFSQFLRERIDIYLGDLTSSGVVHDPKSREKLVSEMTSIIHCAASLNRKSAKACFNVNLRGTLEVIKLARAAHEDHGLRRFSDISTVAVSGIRESEVVKEEHAVDWSRSDYDPYARTKKFCEHMIHELLPEISCTVFRPSIVLGDSRFPETTQFDMVRAFAWLAQMPVLPFKGEWLADIVPANYVSRAVVTIHQKENPLYDTYNLSAGTASMTYREIVQHLKEAGHGRRPLFAPWLNGSFNRLINTLANTPRRWGVALPASLMKVFLPYLTFNTVFDNSRVVEELGEAPATFDTYAYPLLRFALDGKFTYDFEPWPEEISVRKVA
jgi:thioester reductase-like protein